jgi:AAA domain
MATLARLERRLIRAASARASKPEGGMKRTSRAAEEAPLDGAFAIDRIRRELAELSPHARAELDRHVLAEMGEQPSPAPKDGEPRGRTPRLYLVPFNEIKLGTERRDLVKGLVPRVGLTVAWGPPKEGKSFKVFDMAMHIALGWEYRGRRVHQGPVVYCAFEGQSGIKARVEAWRQTHLAKTTEAVPFYLEPVRRPSPFQR